MDRVYSHAAIFGEQVKVAALPGGGYEIISLSDDTSVPLPGDVGTALVHGAVSEYAAEASLEGTLPASRPAAAKELADLTAQVRRQLPGGSVVLFDSTTAANALQVVSGSHLATPLRMLDLSLLTYAALTSDGIVMQPSSASVAAAQQYRLFHVITSPGQTFEENLLRSSNVSVDHLLRTPGMIAALQGDWRRFLSGDKSGAGWVRLDAAAFDRQWESPQYWDDVVAVDYEEGLLSRSLAGMAPTDKHTRRRTNDYLTVQTYRAFRNLGVAGILGVPYYGSVLRLPAYERAMRAARRRSDAVEQILSSAAGRVTPSTAPGIIRLKAPVPLRLVLGRMHKPDDYFGVLTELREEFRELRRDMHRRLAAEEPPESIARDYERKLNRLGSATTSAGPVVTFIAAAAAIPFVLVHDHFALPADQIASALGALSSIPCFQRLLARWAGRAAHPHIGPLLALGEQAGQISALAYDVERIWRTAWSDEDHAVLDGVARQAHWMAFRSPA